MIIWVAAAAAGTWVLAVTAGRWINRRTLTAPPWHGLLGPPDP